MNSKYQKPGSPGSDKWQGVVYRGKVSKIWQPFPKGAKNGQNGQKKLTPVHTSMALV